MEKLSSLEAVEMLVLSKAMAICIIISEEFILCISVCIYYSFFSSDGIMHFVFLLKTITIIITVQYYVISYI